MPLGKVFDATQNQVLFSPVSNYYQGKAIRAGLKAQEQDSELKGLQIEATKQELADAPAKQRAAEEMAELDRQKAILDVEKGIADLGYERMKRRSDALRPVVREAERLFQSGDQEGAARYISEGVPAALQDVDPDAAAQIAEMAGPDRVWQPEEMMRLKNRVEAFGALDEGGDQRRTLTSEEAMALPGMTPDRANNAVIQVDESGQIFIDDAPTGLSDVDLAVRGGVSASGVSKNTIEFQDNVVGAISAIQTGTELMTSSAENPEALGVPGGFMRFGANLVSGAKAIADWAGYERPSAADAEKQFIGSSAFNYDKIDLDKLGVSGAEAEKFRAGVYGIAFAAAVAEQGTRPTDKDIQQFIDQVGGRATSAQSFRETIVQFMRRQDRRLKAIADVKQIGEADREAAFSAWTPAYRNFMETYAKTSGKRTSTIPETGERFIELSKDKWEPF